MAGHAYYEDFVRYDTGALVRHTTTPPSPGYAQGRRARARLSSLQRRRGNIAPLLLTQRGAPHRGRGEWHSGWHSVWHSA